MAKIYVSQSSVRPFRWLLRILGWASIAAGIYILCGGKSDFLDIYLPLGGTPGGNIGMGAFLVILDLLLPDPYRQARREKRRQKRQKPAAQAQTATAASTSTRVTTQTTGTSGTVRITGQRAASGDTTVIPDRNTSDHTASRIQDINALLDSRKKESPPPVSGTPLGDEDIQLGHLLDPFYHGCDFYRGSTREVMKYIAIPDGPQGFGPIKVPPEIQTLEQLLPWLVENHDFHLKP